MNAFPAGPLAANRPNESCELENSERVLPLVAFIRIFRSLGTRTSAHCDLSVQIQFVPDALVSADLFDSVLAQLTVSNILELVGQHLEKCIFLCRRKLSFSIFNISIER